MPYKRATGKDSDTCSEVSKGTGLARNGPNEFKLDLHGKEAFSIRVHSMNLQSIVCLSPAHFREEAVMLTDCCNIVCRVHCQFMARLFCDVDLSHISIAEHRDHGLNRLRPDEYPHARLLVSAMFTSGRTLYTRSTKS